MDTSLVFNIFARDRASKTFDKIKYAAAAAGTGIGLSLTAGIMSAVAKSRTDALLAAQLGADPQSAAELGRASGGLYARGVVESVEAAGAAIRAAVQNGLVSKDATAAVVEAAGAKVSELSALMEEDAGRVSASVSQMLRTGIASSAEEAFDTLAAATSRGLNKSQDLLDTVEEYGTQFRSLGLSGAQAMGLIAQGLDAGARNADLVADTIKEFAIEAVAGGARVRSGFTAVGLSADAMVAKFAAGGPAAAQAFGLVLNRLRGIENPAKRNAAAVQLFGTKAEDMAGALSALDPSKAVAALGQVSGAAQRAGQTLEQSAGAKLESFRRKAEMGLVQVLGTAAGWIEKNNGLLGTLAIVLAPITGIIATIVVATKVWTAVQLALNVAMMANPIGLIILGIMALVGVIILAWNKSETFRNVVLGAWEAIQTGVGVAVSWVKNAVAWFGQLPGMIGGWFTGAKNAAVNAWNSMVAWIRGIPGKIRAALGVLVQIALKIGRDLVRGLINGISNMREAVVNAAMSVVGGAVTAVKRFLGIASPSRLFTWVGNMTGAGLVKGLLSSLPDIKSAAKKMTDTVRKAWQEGRIGRGAASRLLTRIERDNQLLQAAATSRAEIVQKIVDARKYATDIAASAKDSAGLGGMDWGGRAVTAGGIQTRLAAQLSRIQRFGVVVKSLAAHGLHKSLLRQIVDSGPGAGLDLGMALLQADAGMRASINSAQSAIERSSASLGLVAADALYDSGKQAGQGFLSGLLAQQTAITKAMTRMARTLVNQVRKDLGVGVSAQLAVAVGPARGTVTASPRAGAGGAAPQTLVIRLETDGAEDDLLRLLRKIVRVRGGGNVQLALGR